MFHKTCVAALLISALFALGSLSAWAAGTVDNGVKQYNLGRYRHAILYFSLAVEEEPHNALAHYYLADSLVRTGHHEEAIVEYGLCYRLNPHSQVAAYCKQALKGYKQPIAAADKAPPHTTGGVSRFDGSGRLIGTTDEEELVARTKSHIRQEVIYEKAKHQQMGEFFATGVLSQAEAEAGRIQQEAAREIEATTQPQPVVIGKMVHYVQPDPELAKVRVEEIKRLAAERAEQTKKVAQARADRYKEWSKDRQNSLDEVVTNLESQLEEPAGQSGVKLQPVGTDLYTRYYGTLRASSQLPDVRPAAVRIIEHPTGIRGSEGRLPPDDQNDQLRVEKVVRGSVLH